MGTATRDQILDKAIIFHVALIPLGNSSSTSVQIVGLFNHGTVTGRGGGKLFKKIDLMSHVCNARDVMVIVIGNGHGNTSSNPGRCGLHFTTLIPFRKGLNVIILPPTMDK